MNEELAVNNNCNRTIKHIRFSVTSACNYNCIYCDKEGFIPKTSLLSVDEITRLCTLLATTLNVTKIKLTGGEPLCRKEIVSIVKNISNLHLYKDISMTTNGFFLKEMASDLYNAGLNRINISLCSLKPSVFKKITGVDALELVLKGLKAAQKAGLYPIKLNYVMLKGLNDQELDDIIDFCSKTGYILQLIELHKRSEAIGKELSIFDHHHAPIENIVEDIKARAIETFRRNDMQNRYVFKLPNNAVIETIQTGKEACNKCTKLRVGCDGNLFGCLFRSDLGTNIKSELNDLTPSLKSQEIIQKVISSREPYYK
ncbi:MAG: GTP 3',8-cyclase MoaA [Candidatus Lokiarchaeota archaeon]|nr:GTP 3',8-cyclase MoaA [Candidatus Lokiarchaeota archaeon]